MKKTVNIFNEDIDLVCQEDEIIIIDEAVNRINNAIRGVKSQYRKVDDRSKIIIMACLKLTKDLLQENNTHEIKRINSLIEKALK